MVVLSLGASIYAFQNYNFKKSREYLNSLLFKSTPIAVITHNTQPYLFFQLFEFNHIGAEV